MAYHISWPYDLHKRVTLKLVILSAMCEPPCVCTCLPEFVFMYFCFHLFACLSLYLYLCVGGGTCVTLSLARRVYEPEPDLNSPQSLTAWTANWSHGFITARAMCPPCPCSNVDFRGGRWILNRYHKKIWMTAHANYLGPFFHNFPSIRGILCINK